MKRSLLVAAGAGILVLTLSGAGALAALDAWLPGFAAQHRSPGLTSALGVLSDLHDTDAILMAAAVVAAVLALRRSWDWLLTFVLAQGGGMLLNVVVKAAYARDRPDAAGALAHATYYSFPSGHTNAAALFYAMLCVLAFEHGLPRRLRPWLVAGAASMVLCVAFSRVYLGVHYPSDVVGALGEACAWLAFSLALHAGGRPTRHDKAH
ncbi:phosphatase PAP2 family protein [Ramlibacter sp.]|uniref:phosphatase PAP2 family protein n=1 Tax=Ramlibacter sp. TaxID=1917967 RepID=UPI003D0F6089